MKITKVSVNRKFNLGNYESLDISMESEIHEAENPQEIIQIMRDNIEMKYIDMQRAKEKQTVTGQQAAVPSHPATTVSPTPAPAPNNHPLAGLTKEQSESLTADRRNGEWIIQANSYLKPSLFREVHAYIQAKGGKYVPATGDSHPYWRIPA